jgi:hypothetical protein
VTDTPRYDKPITVMFGEQEITAGPLRGLERLKAFEQALIEEVHSLQKRVEDHARQGTRVSAEALLETGVDEVRLLKLGLPDQITDEILAQSTARERIGLLTDICFLNNLGRFSPFLAIEGLIELASKLNQRALEFPMPASSPSSSEPVSLGATSSAN